MDVMILDPADDLEMLRPLGDEWKALAHGIDYGLPLDVDVWLNTMKQLVNQNNSNVLVLVSGGVVKGHMGLAYGKSHVGPGKIVNECCFFVSTSARGGGLKLLHAAEQLAKSKGCNFSTMNASKIAGDADRSGKLYEHCGYVPFETSYLKAL